MLGTSKMHFVLHSVTMKSMQIVFMLFNFFILLVGRERIRGVNVTSHNLIWCWLDLKKK